MYEQNYLYFLQFVGAGEIITSDIQKKDRFFLLWIMIISFLMCFLIKCTMSFKWTVKNFL